MTFASVSGGKSKGSNDGDQAQKGHLKPKIKVIRKTKKKGKKFVNFASN